MDSSVPVHFNCLHVFARAFTSWSFRNWNHDDKISCAIEPGFAVFSLCMDKKIDERLQWWVFNGNWAICRFTVVDSAVCDSQELWRRIEVSGGDIVEDAWIYDSCINIGVNGAITFCAILYVANDIDIINDCIWARRTIHMNACVISVACVVDEWREWYATAWRVKRKCDVHEAVNAWIPRTSVAAHVQWMYSDTTSIVFHCIPCVVVVQWIANWRVIDRVVVSDVVVTNSDCIKLIIAGTSCAAFVPADLRKREITATAVVDGAAHAAAVAFGELRFFKENFCWRRGAWVVKCTTSGITVEVVEVAVYEVVTSGSGWKFRTRNLPLFERVRITALVHVFPCFFGRTNDHHLPKQMEGNIKKKATAVNQKKRYREERLCFELHFQMLFMWIGAELSVTFHSLQPKAFNVVCESWSVQGESPEKVGRNKKRIGLHWNSTTMKR